MLASEAVNDSSAPKPVVILGALPARRGSNNEGTCGLMVSVTPKLLAMRWSRKRLIRLPARDRTAAARDSWPECLFRATHRLRRGDEPRAKSGRPTLRSRSRKRRRCRRSLATGDCKPGSKFPAVYRPGGRFEPCAPRLRRRHGPATHQQRPAGHLDKRRSDSVATLGAGEGSCQTTRLRPPNPDYWENGLAVGSHRVSGTRMSLPT